MSSRAKRQLPNTVALYDTTLRDGAQRKGISFSLADKLKIAGLLDEFGVSYIEGGWPGSNPKDREFFQRVAGLGLRNARVVAFGSTRKAGGDCAADTNLTALIEAGTPSVALVGKASGLHVDQVLRASRQENLDMIRQSVRYMKDHGLETIFDAEHFFDGYAGDPDYAMACLQAADEGGADWLVLCDTNGGTMPGTVARVVAEVESRFARGSIGVHCHNDSELAVANSIAAVEAGARQVQGTINGYGERCGNANLISVVPALQMKLGYQCVQPQKLAGLTELSRAVSEIANLSPDPYAPYVGSAAFAHKAGLHAAAVCRFAGSYEHIEPESVGNQREVLVSELSGRSNLRHLARQLDVAGHEAETQLLSRVKELEQKGYKFEDARGSVELMLLRTDPAYRPPFQLLDMSVEAGNGKAEAVVKLEIGQCLSHTVAEGDGPVHALDLALRKALLPFFPELGEVKLVDYKVRILDPENATGATTRVVIEAASGEKRWSTVGCSENIIEASCQALCESMELCLSGSQKDSSYKPQEVVA